MATSTTTLEAIDTTSPALPPGPGVVYEWLTTVDHKKIGLMYIVYALLFLVIAGKPISTGLP